MNEDILTMDTESVLSMPIGYNIPSFEGLRKAGYIVDVQHFRKVRRVFMKTNGTIEDVVAIHNTEEINKLKAYDLYKSEVFQVLPNGGFTQMNVKDPSKGDWELVVSADCHPKDQYNRKTGVKLCLERVAINLIRRQQELKEQPLIAI